MIAQKQKRFCAPETVQMVIRFPQKLWRFSAARLIFAKRPLRWRCVRPTAIMEYARGQVLKVDTGI